jgi:hypothetical protein
VGIETKSRKGALTQVQVMRHEVLRQMGCPVILARSVQDVRDGLKAAGFRVP